MPIIDIHGKKVHIEEDSHSVKHAAQYLTDHADNARAFFDEAHRNITSGVAHFEIPGVGGYNGSHHFTMLHNGDGTYTLRKRTGY